ncbi:pyridoxamine 5'-phosphate oxidase [Nakamurella sp. UYEF19]|uniref:pyridoxamine 5'-phosphate oxidase n=1 Tax=Nakamurella sp. UYEF19 TaxID=1756392 RepID=UPI00339AA5C8
MSIEDLARMRENYTLAGLQESDLAADWVSQFASWLDQAVEAGVTEPNAMVVATSGSDGRPTARTVLAKAVDGQGVVFYTNYTSSKSHDLDENPWAAATFPWYQLQRQVHVRGPVHKVDEATSLQYWRTRPRASQIGAWSSPQSTVVAGRDELDRLQQRVEDQFGARHLDHPAEAEAQEIPLPPHWGGWRIEPMTVEFWQGRTGRMHDRLRYRLVTEHGVEDRWVVERLAP